MARERDAGAVRCEPGEDTVYVSLAGRVEAVGRLVEHEQPRSGEQGGGEPEPLTHATWALLREAELVGRAPRVSKEVVAVAVSQANGCQFCIDAHTILIHAHGAHELAEDLLHDRSPAEPAHAELAAWAASTRRLDTNPPLARPFPAEHAAEYLGTALATPFTNRMFSAFTDEQLMPGNLQRSGSCAGSVPWRTRGSCSVSSRPATACRSSTASPPGWRPPGRLVRRSRPRSPP
ncbi:carboxymuconolactone decarboxylase family protein [Micromonospora chersina]